MAIMQTIFGIFTLIMAISLYFVPAMVAIGRRHVNALPIFLTNLYMGWTVLGWIAALIWALSNTVAAAPATAAAYAPTSSSSSVPMPASKAGRYAMIAGAVFAVLFILVFFLTPVPPGGIPGDAPGVRSGNVAAPGKAAVRPAARKPAAPVTTGVPQPAEAILGGE